MYIVIKENVMSPTAQETEAGQAVYTPRTLQIYDLWVLGVSNRLIWQCPTALLLKHYSTHVTDNHLDVGVGSGYYLDRCEFTSGNPRVALMDLNPNSLQHAASRIARYAPETYRRNVLEPVAVDADKFDSVAVNYLFHCLPGTMAEKSVVFDHLLPLLNPGATIFGSTILQAGVRRGWISRRLMDVYNRKGIFSNTQDGLTELESGLAARFIDVNVRTIGCVALFSARVSGTAGS